MKVGELASRTGLSVRTLHHYDEIGLLRPRRRTPSRHRLYGMEEVRRLQQIASLRHLGLTLGEIRGCLDKPAFALERVLELQIGRIREEIGRQSRLVDLLESLRKRVALGEALSLEDVTAAIEGTLHFERYYTPEQRAELASRAAAAGPEEMRAAQQEWATLFEALTAAHADGCSPSDERVLSLARKARELIRAFTGGDPGIEASLARMYRDGAGAEAMKRWGMGLDPGLWDYYGQAMAALRAAEE